MLFEVDREDRRVNDLRLIVTTLPFASSRVYSCGGKQKCDLGAFLPEEAGKLVGEKQRVIAPAGGENRNRLIETRPVHFEIGLEPVAKFESMHASAQHDDAEKFFACHGFLAERVEVTSSGSAPVGPTVMQRSSGGATGKFNMPLSKMVLEYIPGLRADSTCLR